MTKEINMDIMFCANMMRKNGITPKEASRVLRDAEESGDDLHTATANYIRRSKKIDVPTEEWQKHIERKFDKLYDRIEHLYNIAEDLYKKLKK